MEFLLEKGYEVHGIKRRSSSFNTERIDNIYQDPHSKNVRLTQTGFNGFHESRTYYQEVQPDEIYNLGAMSHVKVSFDMPEYVANVDGMGTLRLLEAIRVLGLEKKTRIYQASTSELYGGMPENKNAAGFYDEDSPFYPRSPYGVAKICYWITKITVSSIFLQYVLFNHESPRRGETFVTENTRATARIALGTK